MNRILLSATALSLLGLSLHAQPPAAAAPRKVRPAFVDDDQALQSGSFELPRVTERTPRDSGGSIISYGQGEWATFAPNAAAKDGQVVAGLTNESAHSGKQSVFVQFKQAKAPSAGYELSTTLVPVKPTESYHVSLWGRLDEKDPIIVDQREPVLQLQVDFFQADGETQTGESNLRVQAIPGDANRPHFFTSDRWTEYYADLEAPADAAFVKATWHFITPPEPGETNGIIYLDDAGIKGARVPPPVEPPEAAVAPAPAEPAK